MRNIHEIDRTRHDAPPLFGKLLEPLPEQVAHRRDIARAVLRRGPAEQSRNTLEIRFRPGTDSKLTEQDAMDSESVEVATQLVVVQRHVTLSRGEYGMDQQIGEIPGGLRLRHVEVTVDYPQGMEGETGFAGPDQTAGELPDYGDFAPSARRVEYPERNAAPEHRQPVEAAASAARPETDRLLA